MVLRAIVLGSKSVNATGLIRSLGMEEIYVIFASSYSKIESRYTKEYLKLPEEKNKWINILIQFSHKFNEKIAIFPTDDETAYWLDQNYHNLQENFIVPHAKGKIQTIADKSVMNELAKNIGLNVPNFIKISLSDAKRENKYPIILKPYAGYAGSKGDILICYNENEYITAVEKLKTLGYKEILLQQLLDDLDQKEIGIMGISLENGKVVIPGIIHKIRSYPTGKGSTSFAKFTPDTSGIDIEKIKKFVSSTGYVGIFDIEMIKAYNKYWFIEINYRNGQYGYIPTVAGYNLPTNWLYGMKQKKIKKCDNLKEIYYINERDDYQHVKNGEISLKKWIKQFHMAKAYGMYCPGDQRPFVRQYIKIPDRIIVKFKRLNLRIKDLIFKEEWNIAIRKKDGEYLWQENGTEKFFNVLPNTIRYWAADPFIISNGEKDYIFFEMFDRFKGKGLIGYREINENKIGKMKIAYQANYHLSFPFIFKCEGKYYMLPEYSEGKELFLLEAIHFPDKWEKVSTLINERRLVDSVLLKYNDKNYLFTQDLKDEYVSDELLIFIQEGDKWISHNMNPVIKNLTNARLAGKIYKDGNQLIRVSQDCKNGYGMKLHFSKISKLNEEEFFENMFKTVDVNDVKMNCNKKFVGIHTYNSNNRYEVIDLKNISKIKIGNIINVLLKGIHKLKYKMRKYK